MNRGDFIYLVENSHSIQNEHIAGLQEIIQEFPYFQTGQLLLSKAFQNTENINFEKQLRKTAAFAANRKVLHDLLFQDKIADKKIQNIVPVDNEIEKTQVVDQIETSIETKAETIEIIVETDTEKIDEPEYEEKDRTLEQQILSAAISSSILLEVSDDIDLEGFQTSPKDSFGSKSTKEFAKEVLEDSFNEQTTHSFSDWLSHYSDKEEPILNWEKETDYEETYQFEASNLPTKAEFYSPAKMARLSVQENDDLVTETLANIYADQGAFEKAIKAFKKLQLKYPEKKIYFATRIKEIENQLNSQ